MNASSRGLDLDRIVAVLGEASVALEILGENPFKVRAYAGAARALDALDADLDTLIAEKRLTDIKGIGKGLAEKIVDLRRDGADPEIDLLMRRVPSGIFEMLAIPGFGPKKAKAVWEKLGVTTVGELEYACNENRLIELPGFGEKTQEKILVGIRALARYAGRRLRARAADEAARLLAFVESHPSVVRAAVAGSFRRGLETVKDIDLVASSADPTAVMAAFVKADGVEEVIGAGSTKASVRLASGLQADLRVVGDDEFPHTLHHFTGSKAHNIELRSYAKKKGFALNEYALTRGDETIRVADERELYATLGLAYIPPELREGHGEIAVAARGGRPWSDLIAPADITGIFHCHTVASDGKNTLEEMAAACRDRGWAYLGVSDHSRAASYAGGLSIDELARQGEEADRVMERFPGLTIYKGIESDILPDGSLDYPDDVLDKLDFVIASVHSGFVADEKKMTDRIVTAVKNPFTTMLGHLTGRLLLTREGYPVNVPKIIEACAEHRVAIELNANPHRLDLDWRHLRAAVDAGVVIAVNPDAHRIAGLDHVAEGVMAARKGGLAPRHVLNAWAPAAVAQWLKGKR
ncbi:MAG: DNA polymerase/3'-5' exonuclease PolX [Nitrospinae bacterium]|nr:DNA polymerase/3'-5' exonuclease PolX [Nitrospinota bacterium]